MYMTQEMELIAKIYGYLDKEDKEEWTSEKAQDVYEDELKISAEHGYMCPIENAEVLYDTIKELIQQDYEDEE